VIHDPKNRAAPASGSEQSTEDCADGRDSSSCDVSNTRPAASATAAATAADDVPRLEPGQTVLPAEPDFDLVLAALRAKIGVLNAQLYPAAAASFAHYLRGKQVPVDQLTSDSFWILYQDMVDDGTFEMVPDMTEAVEVPVPNKRMAGNTAPVFFAQEEYLSPDVIQHSLFNSTEGRRSFKRLLNGAAANMLAKVRIYGAAQ
jgi:hypothetical protein